MNTIEMLVVEHDFVLEDQMSRLIGYPEGSRALETKRQRGIIPAGVYATIDGRITYSIKRYNAWMESLWPREKLMGSRRELNSLEKASAFDSCGTSAAAAKPSPSRKPRRASKPQPVLELR
ncbi:hypothetical protein [Pseudomonas fluorescens]|uniref:hypothetical protein n=1 Tax=Pseudomonas fluorescens TaxID=294 RepID=UPI00209FAA4C|nr:hypothetical protein [Pseudomonas fluorescens]